MVSMERPIPPCMHRILPSIRAASGSQLNRAFMRCQAQMPCIDGDITGVVGLAGHTAQPPPQDLPAGLLCSHLRVAKSIHTLYAEAKQGVDVCRLVVAPDEVDALRVLNLKGQKEANGFQGVRTAVDEITCARPDLGQRRENLQPEFRRKIKLGEARHGWEGLASAARGCGDTPRNK